MHHVVHLHLSYRDALIEYYLPYDKVQQVQAGSAGWYLQMSADVMYMTSRARPIDPAHEGEGGWGGHAKDLV